MATFYGSDTFCLTDIPLIDTQVTDPRVLIGQRLVRRLSTQRGALAFINDDPNAGFDVRQLMNAKLTQSFLAQSQSQIRNECLKDEEVETVNVSLTTGNNSLVIVLAVTTSTGPFALTLNIDQLTLEAVFSF